MARHAWGYSRKTPGPYNAYGPTRIWREPIKARGTLVRESDRAWLVSFDELDGTHWVSKEHARMDGETWTIPPWLWDKIAEGA
ncbi:MAG TPA: hypothetical protein VJP88_08710 [Caulobacteraceae bacterium]|nr:hypothetical protein [Caulobacteraceae bacterium]